MDVIYNLLGVDNASQAINRVQSAFDGLDKTWTKVVGALGMGGSVAYLTNLVKQSIEAGDRIGELSQITGVSVEALSGLQVAAKTSGLNLEALATTLGKMSKNLTGVEEPGGNAARALDALGINAEKFKTAKVEDRLLILAEALEGVDNSSGDATAAMEMLVKGGSALIPMLSGGADGLREMMATADALGLKLTSETVSSMDAVADTLTIMGMQGQGLGNTIASKLMPTLEGLSKLWLDNAKNGNSFGQVVGTAVEYVFKTIVSLGSAAWDVLKGVGIVLGGLFAAIETRSMDPLKQSWADANHVMAEGKERIDQLWSNSLPKMTEAEKAVAKAVDVKSAAQVKAQDASAKAAAQAEDLRKKLLDQVSALEQNTVGSNKLSDAQKLMIGVGEALRDGKLRLTDAEKQEIFARLELVDATVAARKAQEEFTKAQDKAQEEYAKGTARIVEQAEKLELETQQLGLTKEAQAALTIEQRNNEIARLEALLTTDMVLLAGEEEIANINARIAALQRLNSAEGNLAAKGALVEAAKKTQTEWDKTAQTIESSLTDALMRGFESGKDFAKNLKDTLINLFKTLVLKPIIQPIAQSAAGTLLGVLGIPTTASASGGAAGGLGNLGSVFSLGSSLAGLGSYAATGLEFVLGGGSLATALGSAVELGGLSGLATGVGAAAPYLLPIIAGAFALSKLLGDKRSPAQQNFGFVNAAGMDVAGEGFYAPVVKNGGVSTDYTSTLQTLSGAYRGIVEDLGGAINDQIRFGLFTSASPDNLGAQVVANVVTPTGDLYRFNENGPNETMSQRLAAQSPAMIAAALKATDFDDRVDAIFARLSATPTADELGAAVAEAKAIVSPADEATIDTAETVSRLETLVQQSTDAQTTMITVLRDILANGETGNAVAGDGFTQVRDRLDELVAKVGAIESRFALAEAA